MDDLESFHIWNMDYSGDCEQHSIKGQAKHLRKEGDLGNSSDVDPAEVF